MKNIKYVYADNAATTKLDNQAFNEMQKYLLYEYGNPSAGYSFSRKPKEAIIESREIIASCINAKPQEIVFTSGGTESNNWVIYNACINMNKEKDFFVTTNIEHHAILKSCKMVESVGYNVEYAKVTDKGIVDEADYLRIIEKPNCIFSSIMTVNNEVGIIQNIKKLVNCAHKKNIVFHTDAVQAVGHIPVDVDELGVDMLSASAHKFNGPRGIGFLYVKEGTKISPLINGGKQEMNLRAGTENVASIVGMAISLKNNLDTLKENIAHENKLRTYFIENMYKTGLDFRLNSDLENGVPGIISVSFNGVNGEMIMHRMDLMKIAISTGAACNSRETEISHVITNIHLPDAYANGTIRISFGKENTISDVDRIINALIKILVR